VIRVTRLPEKALLKIHAFPRKRKNLANAQPRIQGKHSNIGYDAPKDLTETKSKIRLGSGDPRISTAEMQVYTLEETNATTTKTLVDAAKRLADELPEDTPPDKVLSHWLAAARSDDAAEDASRNPADDAALDTKKEDADRFGVIIGSGIGGLPLIEEMHKKMLERGPSRISPFFIPGLIVNLASGHISIRFNCRGPSSAPATACATGAHAIGDAFKIIQRDEADLMFAGGSEAVVTPLAIGGFSAMRALSTRNDDPQHASRPILAPRHSYPPRCEYSLRRQSSYGRPIATQWQRFPLPLRGAVPFRQLIVR